jgi:hypothetical protein
MRESFTNPGYNSYMVLHCTASGCADVGVPVYYGAGTTLTGITVLSPGNIWVVGANHNNSIIEHWDGSAWTAIAHPSSGILSDVVAVAPDDIWAVGPGKVLHWDGTAWSVSPAPYGAVALARSGPTDVWAVGVLLMHYPALPRFSDVPVTNPFYIYIQDLACRGVISGYADGTFRPGANTTRGQLCKIVVLAEGWTINTTGGPHFVDVPPTDPFYGYIETAYNRDIISGYSCGPGCLEFRPGANVTRGQICKIVVLAEGWALTCPEPGHFSDVTPDNPFFCYIETAYGHNIISGYADGTFRPGNNATRGQICKIVYNAINE